MLRFLIVCLNRSREVAVTRNRVSRGESTSTKSPMSSTLTSQRRWSRTFTGSEGGYLLFCFPLLEVPMCLVRGKVSFFQNCPRLQQGNGSLVRRSERAASSGGCERADDHSELVSSIRSYTSAFSGGYGISCLQWEQTHCHRTR